MNAGIAEVSVGIVAFRDYEQVRRLLQSAQTFAPPRANVRFFVADNTPDHGVANALEPEFPGVTWLRTSRNGGFGYGHNAILGMVDSDVHVIVNPDVVFTSDALTPLMTALISAEDVVAVTPWLTYPDGSPQFVPRRRPTLLRVLSSSFFFLRSVRDRYTMAGPRPAAPVSIDVCSGCFLMAATQTLRDLGGFDQGYFLYFEDTDLSMKLRARGRILLIPDVSVVHAWARESRRSVRMFWIQVRSMVRFFHRWGVRSWRWGGDRS